MGLELSFKDRCFGPFVNEGEEIVVTKHNTKMLFAILDRRDYFLALQKKKGLMG